MMTTACYTLLDAGEYWSMLKCYLELQIGAWSYLLLIAGVSAMSYMRTRDITIPAIIFTLLNASAITIVPVESIPYFALATILGLTAVLWKANKG